jgi:hypothetical protein
MGPPANVRARGRAGLFSLCVCGWGGWGWALLAARCGCLLRRLHVAAVRPAFCLCRCGLGGARLICPLGGRVGVRVGGRGALQRGSDEHGVGAGAYGPLALRLTATDGRWRRLWAPGILMCAGARSKATVRALSPSPGPSRPGPDRDPRQGRRRREGGGSREWDGLWDFRLGGR